MEVPLYKVCQINPRLLEQTLSSGWIGQGQRVEEFEKALEEYLGTERLLTTNSCTSALQLALELLHNRGQYPEPEVITTPFTCIAVASAIHHAYCKIVWADIEHYTYNIDLNQVAHCLNDHTMAVVVPHLCGDPIDLHRLYNILRRHYNTTGNIVYVIEDCASAFGSKYNDKYIGAHHNDINYPHENSIKCFSFQAVKTLTTGDGGAIVLPNDKLYERAKRLRWYGLSREEGRYSQQAKELGFKFHMNDIAASIGLTGLESVDSIIDRQIENREFYHVELKSNASIKYYGRTSACGQFLLRIKRRDAFVSFMAERGIEACQPHTRLDKHLGLPKTDDFYILDECCEEIVCIPAGWWVTDEDREHIVKSVKEWNG